jgi:hypothetical protein
MTRSKSILVYRSRTQWCNARRASSEGAPVHCVLVCEGAYAMQNTPTWGDVGYGPQYSTRTFKDRLIFTRFVQRDIIPSYSVHAVLACSGRGMAIIRYWVKPQAALLVHVPRFYLGEGSYTAQGMDQCCCCATESVVGGVVPPE